MPKHKAVAEEILFCQIDKSHHPHVPVCPDKATAKEERAQLEANHKRDVESVKVFMFEEVQGPVNS